MARGINKVILIGNLGADPEVRYTPNGVAITNISLATTDNWKDKQTGERQERTEWHRVVIFNRLGEIAGEYLRRGSKVYIEGRLQTRKWVDKTNVERYTTEIIASELQMLDSRGQTDGSNYPSSSAGNQSARPNHAPSSASSDHMGPTPTPAGVPDDFDDDIPF